MEGKGLIFVRATWGATPEHIYSRRPARHPRFSPPESVSANDSWLYLGQPGADGCVLINWTHMQLFSLIFFATDPLLQQSIQLIIIFFASDPLPNIIPPVIGDNFLSFPALDLWFFFFMPALPPVILSFLPTFEGVNGTVGFISHSDF